MPGGQNIKLLALCGSQTSDPAMLDLIEHAFEGAREVGGVDTQVVELRGKSLRYCVQCEACLSRRKRRDGTWREELQDCTIKDDLQSIHASMVEADGIIWASPVHALGVSAQLRAVVDRSRWLVHQGNLRWKAASALSIAAEPMAGQELALRQMGTMIRALQMTQVGPGYGSAGAYSTPGDPRSRATARATGRAVAEAARLFKAGRQSLPETERSRIVESYHRLPKAMPDYSSLAPPNELHVKLLGISGAHRKGARNTVYMLRAALEAARQMGGVETELINLRDLHLKAGHTCEECLAAGLAGCGVQDDMQGLYPRLASADAVIFASPVHELGISGRLKNFVDRCRWMQRDGTLRGKVAGALTVAYMTIGGQETAIAEISDFIRAFQMYQTGFMFGGMGVSGPAVGGHTPWGEDGRTRLTPVENDPWGMMTSRFTGRMVAELALVVKAGQAALSAAVATPGNQ
ncbi:MAG: flavodoxin family protein [Dehalococcoidia bacterium]